MPQNFIGCDREQVFLMPPSLREWLPEDHLAWFVIETVEGMDLEVFYGAYRADGHGRAAYEPSMVVTLILYAFATNVRSSRGIERHCRQDVAYRVITGNVVPDHATIARFVIRHERALGEVFGQVLRLCARAGLVRPGVVAVDGSKLAANASRDQSVDYGQIAQEIIAQARASDEQEDREHGEQRGDELPEELSTDAGRRAWLRRELAAARAADETPAGEQQDSPGEERVDEDRHAFDTARIVSRVQGRAGWLRESKRQLDAERWESPTAVRRSRHERLLDAGQRLDAELAAESRGNAAYEHYRATGRDRFGRRLSRPPKPYQPPATPHGVVNLTDPDSHLMKGRHHFVQGYNTQAVVTEEQIILAAEITVEGTDFAQLRPLLGATVRELEQAGVAQTPEVVIADAGYWNEQHMDDVTADHGIQVLIPPDSGTRNGERPGWTGGRYAWMRAVLATPLGESLYRKRQPTIEPVFAHTKHNRKFDRFHRRGRAAVLTEWRLMMATHNLTKLHRHQIAIAGP
jgi:transposase